MEYNDCVFSKLFICCNRISYYNQMLLFSQSLSQIKFYTELIEKELIELKKSRKYCENSFKISENNRYNEDNNMTRQKEFTLEELKKYDGSNGNPAYAAVSGIVYDVSYEATWAGGTHFGLYSGKDLSNEFLGCHKGMAEILNKLPKVGTIK
ncbi:cytochrome b5 domain-containing protein [Clostridium botulinum]|uniref:cytochrome b5 domain-containing protein n=1 Tax=Clostridium botulinum TaxID=1491 RepID=UPI000773DAAD|nr:cytochrome b5 domain-containing protein [Clostridium botulinum]